ncbi:cell division control protein 6 homolog isoform X2 [Varroa jacobsoni]|uniref:Cdc6 C-terminal domain-containing protein n=1 Tax=Varroa destructor TaxID=109461 RepID=A0A7M7MDU7_VARDE|nr:cell division control protein 6 homolog isoform X2 [Varroa destructor]XP_022703461.1 cell division control protein 6 homolog isoform X2 [Varroa jacobsoni]
MGRPRRSTRGYCHICNHVPNTHTKQILLAKSPPRVAINGSLAVAKANSTVYSQARHLLHTQLTDVIIGRDNEIAALKGFIEPALKNKTALSLYISGAPGTGKTVSLTYVLGNLENKYDFRSVFINCMTVKNASSIYAKIAGGLNFTGQDLESVQKGVRKLPCVVVLDEVDQLQSYNQQVLYSLFELVKLKDSRVVLVGIANALDLTDKTVPLLQAYGCRPQLYHFAPYNDKQIIDILKSRLAEFSSIIKPVALAFLAKKVATCTGDVRKALDICRRAVEIVERQVRQQRILIARGGPTASPQKQILVDIKHISEVLSDIFNTRARGNQDLHTTLPLQQKLLLCSILVFSKRRKVKEVTMGKLHEVYSGVCKVAKVAAIDYSELQSICTLLEARALVSIKKAKVGRQSKVSLAVDEAEVEQVLQDKSILAICLDETFAVC